MQYLHCPFVYAKSLDRVGDLHVLSFDGTLWGSPSRFGSEFLRELIAWPVALRYHPPGFLHRPLP